MTLLATAMLLGMRHALDPDHLVAVSTLVAEERRLWPAARLGLIWGLGHMLPIAVLGVPVLLLRRQLPGAMGNVVDLGVGLLLMGLGARTLWRLYQERRHVQAHHDHGHSHSHAHLPPFRGRQGLVTFAIGCVHGLAGSGAVTLLAVTAAPSVASGVGYLLVFSIGTCVGMFLMTLCIAAPVLSTVSRLATMNGSIRAVAGLACMAVGAFMWYEMLPHLLT